MEGYMTIKQAAENGMLPLEEFNFYVPKGV